MKKQEKKITKKQIIVERPTIKRINAIAHGGGGISDLGNI